MRRVRPFYTVQLALYGCVPEVRVNDGPAFEDPDGACDVVEVPVNEWLCDGDNRLSLLLRPLPGEPDFDARTDVEAVVYVREIDQPRELRQEVARLSYAFATDPDPRPPGLEELPELRFDTAFAARLPLPRWRWLSGVPVTDRERAFAEVLAETRAFRKQLQAGDLDGVSSRLRLRDEDTARALYEDLEERRAVTRAEFTELLNDGACELAPLEEEGMTLRLFGRGRLARLDAANGEAPVWYFERGPSLAIYLPLIFFQRAPGNWSVCR
jgi:hypothetical protein